ncbi:Ran-binding protein M homolog [Linum perenne]
MVTGSAVGSQSGSYLQASPSTSDEEMPTELSENRTNKTVVLIKPDKLSVKYTVDSYGNGRYDVGAVQANKPAPVNGKVYYFEMRVKNSGSKHRVAIGFTEEGFNLSRQPGWRAKSIGFHGDNGFLYRGRGTGMPFGASFATGDIVGAGINYVSNEFFFTKNGAMVGVVRKDIDGPLFPTVSVHGQDEEYDFSLSIYLVESNLRTNITLLMFL